MSVINQMLRDLEARRADSAAVKDDALRNLAVGGAAAGRRAPLVWVLAVLVCGLSVTVGILLWQQSLATETTVAAPTTAQPQPTDPTLVSVASPLPASVVAPSNVAASPTPAAPAQIAVASPDPGAERPSSSATVTTAAHPAPTGGRGKEAGSPHAAARPTEDAADELTTPAAPVRIAKRQRALSVHEQTQTLYAEAVVAVRGGDHAAAEAALRQILAADASFAPAYELLAKMFLATGRVVEASSLLERAVLRLPNAISLRKLYARVLADQGQAAQAVAVLKNNPPTVSTDPEYHALLAGFAYYSGLFDEAAARYEALVTVRPSAGNWWVGLGMAAEGEGRADVAREAYTRALASASLQDKLSRFARARLATLPASTAAP